MGCLRTLGNVVWIITGGLVQALIWVLAGVVLFITIIGIPLGKQCFKFAELSLAPFGKKVNLRPGTHPVANAIWAILAGWEMLLLYAVSSIALCITIVGIPFGLQGFKFAKLGLLPFGAEVN